MARDVGRRLHFSVVIRVAWQSDEVGEPGREDILSEAAAILDDQLRRALFGFTGGGADDEVYIMQDDDVTNARSDAPPEEFSQSPIFDEIVAERGYDPRVPVAGLGSHRQDGVTPDESALPSRPAGTHSFVTPADDAPGAGKDDPVSPPEPREP